MFYRLRPLVPHDIEVRRFDGTIDSVRDLMAWTNGRVYWSDDRCLVMTRRGDQRCYANDYVVKYPGGEYGVLTQLALDDRYDRLYPMAPARKMKESTGGKRKGVSVEEMAATFAATQVPEKETVPSWA